MGAGTVEEDFRAKVLASGNLGFINAGCRVIAHGALAGNARRQHDKDLGRANSAALAGSGEHQRQIVNLLVTYHRADIGAFRLDGGSVRQDGYFFFDVARPQSDIERGDGADLDYDTLLQGGLETLGFDGYVVAPNGNIIYAVRAGTAGHGLVNATGISSLDGDDRARHCRAGTIEDRPRDGSAIRLGHYSPCQTQA